MQRRYEMLQKYLVEKENDINNLTDKLEQALVLVKTELKRNEALLKEEDLELKLKGKESSPKEFAHSYTKEYFLTELQEKCSEIKKQKNDYHHLSKAYAELSKQLTQMQKLIQMQKC